MPISSSDRSSYLNQLWNNLVNDINLTPYPSITNLDSGKLRILLLAKLSLAHLAVYCKMS